MTKNIIISGASRGLGRAAALRMAQLGANVAVCAQNEEALKSLAQECPSGHFFYQAFDIAESQQCQNFVQAVVEQFGGLDLVISNAAILGPCQKIAAAAPQDWQRALAVNVTGSLNLCQYSVPHLRSSHGTWVQISSGAALTPIPNSAAYCVTKAAANMLTMTLAQEEPEIMAFNFAPGVVDTDMQADIRREAVPLMPAPWNKYFAELPQSGQLSSPERMAKILCFAALNAPPAFKGRLIDGEDKNLHKMCGLCQ